MPAAYKYAHSVGATRRLTGSYHWKSPRYYQKENVGRYVKFEGVSGEKIKIYDNKLGHILINLDGTRV